MNMLNVILIYKMLNYWWVTRPKRRLNSVPEDLAAFVSVAFDKEWLGNKDLHRGFEEALEADDVKKVGERRDQGGSGARTHAAWLKSLGLIFIQESTQKIQLTLAGEALLNGESPYEVLTNQVIKYQFPSNFSIGRSVEVNRRFKIRPFKFLLKLLLDNRIDHLSQEEIAKIVIVNAENESDKCFEDIVKRIIRFRADGDDSLESDFDTKYSTSKGGRNEDRFGHLLDIANTIINWLDYTRFIYRENGTIKIQEDKKETIINIVETTTPFIDRPEDHEFFQRKYGVDPKHKKDTRDLNKTKVVTANVIVENRVKKFFIAESLKKPITAITDTLIANIAESVGETEDKVADILNKNFANITSNLLDGFLSNYRDMAFSSREKATDFEKATVEIFSDIFGFQSKHVGPIGLTPDVLILSDKEGYSGIIDNKAYPIYSIQNDHHNRMVKNYIGDFERYSGGIPKDKLAFFSYIAGGLSKNIDSQIKEIINETNVSGSAIKVDNFIKMIKNHKDNMMSHSDVRGFFSIGREIRYSDLNHGYRLDDDTLPFAAEDFVAYN